MREDTWTANTSGGYTQEGRSQGISRPARLEAPALSAPLTMAGDAVGSWANTSLPVFARAHPKPGW